MRLKYGKLAYVPYGRSYLACSDFRRVRLCGRGGSKKCPGATPPVRAVAPCGPPNETGCKVARLHNTCFYSVASHSWCQITPFAQSCIMSPGILAPPPQYRSGQGAGHPKLLQLETPLRYGTPYVVLLLLFFSPSVLKNCYCY